MYTWPKIHDSNPYSFWENDLNAKLDKSQWTIKKKKKKKGQNSKLNIGLTFTLQDVYMT